MISLFRTVTGVGSMPLHTPQVLDAGPRGGAAGEVLSALSSKKQLHFFKGDGEELGTYTAFDIKREAQNVGMVQLWNQSNDMLLTSVDKREAVIVMDTETGQCKSELSLRRQQANWNLRVDSITPMQKFEQYKANQSYQIYGLGDDGRVLG